MMVDVVYDKLGLFDIWVSISINYYLMIKFGYAFKKWLTKSKNYHDPISLQSNSPQSLYATIWPFLTPVNC